MQTDQQGIVVAISPASALAARPRLFAALEAAFPVSFVAQGDGGPPSQAAALIVVAPDGPRARREDPARHGLPVLALHGDGDEDAGAQDFRLQSPRGVDARLRDVVLSGRLAGPALDPDGDEVLAVADSGPAWTASAGPAPVHRVRAALGELDHDEPLYALLSRRALAAGALIHFLRAGSAPAGWRPPPLPATI